MYCPKCRREEMKQEVFAGIEIDRCPVCKGVYLDRGELEAMLKLQQGSSADTFAFSATSDAMDAVAAHCFRCDQSMVAFTGPEAIRLDGCQKCGGLFLDQGELATLQLQHS